MRQKAKFGTAAARWAGVGPYYAMFPSEFANGVVLRHTSPGDLVIDPFAGRGTTVFSAAVNRRRGLGVEINPVGWIYCEAKLRPAAKHLVTARLTDISAGSWRYKRAATALPEFFRWCYDPEVLRFLLAARSELDWRHRAVDRTAMAFILINLHGKRDDSLSNQMRQTKSMSAPYAIQWWRKRGLRPPKVDPLQFLSARIEWRYAKGRPEEIDGCVYLGDSIRVLPQLQSTLLNEKARLLLTSPPYYGITNYHYDQWLRLWMLGGPPNSHRVQGRHRGKFEDKEKYRRLLTDVFERTKALLHNDAVIYVRTDRRKLTLDTTVSVLKETFPQHRLRRRHRPHEKPTQTRLFGHSDPRLGEIDLVLMR